jgi:hypothetical protein
MICTKRLATDRMQNATGHRHGRSCTVACDAQQGARLVTMGMEAFAERARGELVATGENSS